VRRVTITAEPKLLEALRRIAEREGTSLAETIRHAMRRFVEQRSAKPKFIGVGASKQAPTDTAARAGEVAFTPRSWR
jgi:hypothetical protein